MAEPIRPPKRKPGTKASPVKVTRADGTSYVAPAYGRPQLRQLATSRPKPAPKRKNRSGAQRRRAIRAAIEADQLAQAIDHAFDHAFEHHADE